MTTTVQIQLPAKDSTRQSTQAGETTDTFLEERNLKLINRLLSTREKYVRHVGCLWTLREILSRKTGYEAKEGDALFPLLETINELVGALIMPGVQFSPDGNAYAIRDGELEVIS